MLKEENILESHAYYHPKIQNPYAGVRVRITLDDSGELCIYSIGSIKEPESLIERIQLSSDWFLENADGAFKLKSATDEFRIDFYPRTNMFFGTIVLSPMLLAMFSSRFKQAAKISDEWRAAIISRGVQRVRHRILFPVLIALLVVFILLLMFIIYALSVAGRI